MHTTLIIASYFAAFAGGIFFDHKWTGVALRNADKAYQDMQAYYVKVYSEAKSELEAIKAKL